MKLLIYKVYNWFLIKVSQYKNRLFSSLLCFGLICFLVIYSECPIYSVKEEEFIEEPIVSENSISVSVNEVEENIDQNTDQNIEKTVNLGETYYGYLFEDFSKRIDTDNVLVTYTSIPFNGESNQSLIVEFGKQGKNQTFSVSTNKAKFALYDLEDTLYAMVENETNVKLYIVDETVQKSSVWNSLYNDTENLVTILESTEYDELSYVDEVSISNRTYVKLVAEKFDSTSENNIEDEDTDEYENIFAIKPAIELMEIPLDEETETNQEIVDSLTERETFDGLVSLDSFNVLTQPGHFVFYFDNIDLKLKRLYVQNDNSITTITMENLYSIKLPEMVELDKAETIDDDRLGRLMLSSIFAMVSDTELNELTNELK